jgi:hypothetical protein
VILHGSDQARSLSMYNLLLWDMLLMEASNQMNPKKNNNRRENNKVMQNLDQA